MFSLNALAKLFKDSKGFLNIASKNLITPLELSIIKLIKSLNAMLKTSKVVLKTSKTF